MSIHEILMSKCELCSGQNIELKMIFKQLYMKFKHLLSSSDLDISLNMEAGFQMEGFVQLLRVLNVHKSQKIKGKIECKHPRFLKMMQKSLNCNSNTLNYLFEITANKIAEKNYGLSLMELQFKNIGDRVVHQSHHFPSPIASQVKIEEQQIPSMTTLPIEKQVQMANGNCVGLLGLTQTTIDQVGVELLSNGYNFYYQFPFFYGKQE